MKKKVVFISLAVGIIAVGLFQTKNSTSGIDKKEISAIVGASLDETISEESVPMSASTLQLNANNLEKTELLVENGSVYLASTEKILEIANTKKISGNGYIRWNQWKDSNWEVGHNGNIYVPYINDEVYLSMKLPSEAPTFMKTRVRPELFTYQKSGYSSAVAIGAVYQITGTTVPEEFDICIGKIATYVLLKSDYTGWKVLDSRQTLKSNDSAMLYQLPWTDNKGYKIPKSHCENKGTYLKYHLKRDDLQNKAFHFWGVKKPVNSADIIGIVTIYEIWTETPEAVGTLAADNGADLKDDSGKNIFQAFAGRSHIVTGERRLVIGHNMPDNVYEQCICDGFSPEQCLEMFKAQ